MHTKGLMLWKNTPLYERGSSEASLQCFLEGSKKGSLKAETRFRRVRPLFVCAVALRITIGPPPTTSDDFPSDPGWEKRIREKTKGGLCKRVVLANVASFRFLLRFFAPSFRSCGGAGNICENYPFWKPPFCKPLKNPS